MDLILERLKEAALFVGVVLLSAITPIANAIFTLMLFFTINFYVGFQADRTEKRAFSLKKAFDAIKLLTLYYSSIFIMHVALSINGEEELATTLTKWVTLIVCYFYMLNIVRNAIKIFPSSKSLRFFYRILRIEIYSYIRNRIGLMLPVKDEVKDDEQ